MQVSETNQNRGAHGDSSFKLDGMPSSSENPTALAVGSVKQVRWERIQIAENRREHSVKPYNEMEKSELIKIIELLQGTVNDLRHDNGVLFKSNKQQMSEIVRLRRQVEAIKTEKEKHGKNKQTKNIRV